MNITSSKSLRDNIKINSLSIGDSGKGKTYFIGTMCDYGKPFILDTEKGLLTISHKEFDSMTVSTYKEVGDALLWYSDNYKKNGYTHLVLDSITRLQQYILLEEGDSTTGVVTMKQWGIILVKLRKIVDYMTKHCPTPVHVTAMAMESRDELTGAVKLYPNIQGAFKFDLAGYFDVVLHHHCGEKNGDQVYYVQTEGDERIIARNRASDIVKLKKFEKSDYGIIHDITIKASNGTK
tara:strand:+ start:267 stop:974 length:708 start_codon:yes stop_codon:yes gene_type:complete